MTVEILMLLNVINNEKYWYWYRQWFLPRCMEQKRIQRGGHGAMPPPQTMDKKIKTQLTRYAYRRAGSRHGSVTLNDRQQSVL